METQTSPDKNFIRNVLLKAALLFLLLNIVFALLPSAQWLGKASLYNHFYPGRWRFSWSENPSAAYNLSTNNLDALFAAHEVSAKPDDEEFRVFFFGDSSVWGFLLPKEETLTAHINQANLHTSDGRTVRAYNLGYPTISLTKDLLLISEAMQYEPDLIVWSTTLEAFPAEKQIFTPMVAENPEEVSALSQQYDLRLPTENLSTPTLFDQSIIGSRREVADLLRLQLYGVLWSATGIDQDIPDSYTPLQTDYEKDHSYYDFSAPSLDRSQLALEVLQAGIALASDVPVLVVNEPVYISSGENSDIRYNFFYPVWAYDDYRSIMQEMANTENWYYIDLWDKIPPEAFTNTAIHIDAAGSQQLAELILVEIQKIINH